MSAAREWIEVSEVVKLYPVGKTAAYGLLRTSWAPFTAKVGGKWQMGNRELTIEQKFQRITGTLGTGTSSQPIEGKLEGDRITFSAGGTAYTGRVNGSAIEGNGWRATKK